MISVSGSGVCCEVLVLRAVDILMVSISVRVLLKFEVGILREEVSIENTLVFIANVSVCLVRGLLHASVGGVIILDSFDHSCLRLEVWSVVPSISSLHGGINSELRE